MKPQTYTKHGPPYTPPTDRLHHLIIIDPIGNSLQVGIYSLGMYLFIYHPPIQEEIHRSAQKLEKDVEPAIQGQAADHPAAQAVTAR
jgi:hypothetical protein